MVLEQLDFVAVTFEYGERYLGTGHAGDFTGEITSMMGPMRKLEAEDPLPEGQRPVNVRDRQTGVVRCDDVKRRTAHADSSANVQRSTRLRKATARQALNSESFREQASNAQNQKIVEVLVPSTCFSVSVVDTTTATTNRLASSTERIPVL
jgi:hypothetical protein